MGDEHERSYQHAGDRGHPGHLLLSTDHWFSIRFFSDDDNGRARHHDDHDHNDHDNDSDDNDLIDNDYDNFGVRQLVRDTGHHCDIAWRSPC